MERTTSRTRHPDSEPAGSSSENGFSVVEVLVSLAVMVVVLGGLLGILQLNSRIARAQVNVSEMQQALRVAQSDLVRDVRVAGRGGLPTFRPPSADDPPTYLGMLLPSGPALAVTNDVPAGTSIDGASGPTVVAGSDILTIRGVLHTTLYQVDPTNDGRVGNTGTGTITIRDRSPTGVPQNLADLVTAINSNRPEGLLLVSAIDDGIQAVVQLTGGADNGTSVQLSFNTGGTHGAQYLQLSPDGGYPTALTTIAAVGIVEEYRYYVRDTAPAPRLSRARFYPGTNAAYAGSAANLQVDVADNVLDLQVALGVDKNGDQIVLDNGDGADDWLYNAPGDADNFNPSDWNTAVSSLYYVRISTLARTDRADPDHQSAPITAIEDHVYDEPATPTGDAVLERKYRRRLLNTVVDLRNLT